MVVWNGSQWENIEKINNKEEEVELLPGIINIKDIEGNNYLAADFGTAGVWMVENLRSRTFDTESEHYGVPIPTNPQWGEKLSPMWKYPGLNGENGNDPSFLEADPSIGLLYNLGAA